MKLRLFAVLTVLMMVLVACQNTNNDDTNPNNSDGNVEPTRYQGQHVDDNARDRNRDHTIDRVSDRNTDAEYNVSKEAAEKITDEMDEIDHAYVLTTRNNAYVGANLDIDNEGNRNNQENNEGSMEITDDVKDRIADIVRSVDSSIDNVYVTSNPDFLDLADRYVNDMDNGNPVEGFFDQIGGMIDRVFPDAK